MKNLHQKTTESIAQRQTEGREGAALSPPHSPIQFQQTHRSSLAPPVQRMKIGTAPRFQETFTTPQGLQGIKLTGKKEPEASTEKKKTIHLTATDGKKHTVHLTGKIEQEQDRLDVGFKAYVGKTEVGYIEAEGAKGKSFVITKVRAAYDDGRTSVPGLGTILMSVATQVAQEHGYATGELSAKKHGNHKHPAPFYHSLGYDSAKGLGGMQDLDKDTKELMLGMMGNIHMSTDLNSSKEKMNEKLGKHNWKII